MMVDICTISCLHSHLSILGRRLFWSGHTPSCMALFWHVRQELQLRWKACYACLPTVVVLIILLTSNYATMRFEPESLHDANAGLHVARAVMEKLKKEFDWISYGDLWTLAGVCAVQEMGGPKIPWRPGRVDGFAKDATPDGRLPDASQGSSHLRDVSRVLIFVPVFKPGLTVSFK